MNPLRWWRKRRAERRRSARAEERARRHERRRMEALYWQCWDAIAAMPESLDRFRAKTLIYRGGHRAETYEEVLKFAAACSQPRKKTP